MPTSLQLKPRMQSSNESLGTWSGLQRASKKLHLVSSSFEQLTESILLSHSQMSATNSETRSTTSRMLSVISGVRAE